MAMAACGAGEAIRAPTSGDAATPNDDDKGKDCTGVDELRLTNGCTGTDRCD